jgi:hypothetical protein
MSSNMGSAIRRIVVHTTVAPTRISVVVVVGGDVVVGGCWRLLAVVGGCWQLLAVVGRCWPLLAVVGRLWRLLAVVGGCWWLLAVVGGCWRLLAVAEKSCCDADNERSDERTKATSSYVDLVGLKVFSSVELSRT